MRALHKSVDHKLGPGRNLTVNFVTKLGQTGIGSTHKNAHNNLRPTWIHPFCERARKESLWGVLIVIFEIKLGETGYESILKNAHNNLRPTWIHPFCERARKESLRGVLIVKGPGKNLCGEF